MELFFVVLVTVTFIALAIAGTVLMECVFHWIDGKLPHEW